MACFSKEKVLVLHIFVLEWLLTMLGQGKSIGLVVDLEILRRDYYAASQE